MPALLAKRNPNLREFMDDPACDFEKLRNSYAQFGLINRLLSGWSWLYQHMIRPAAADRPHTLLDIGFGGGDIPLALGRWAQRDGIKLEITAIDPDHRALAYVKTHDCPTNVSFRQASAEDLLVQGECFDFVISNHLLHHLMPGEFELLCETSAMLSRRLVIHNDIERSDLAYLAFALTRPIFRNSFIVTDGLISIRRSYTYAELAKAKPEGWSVRRMRPYRLLLIHESR